jgi:hypothetical protein
MMNKLFVMLVALVFPLVAIAQQIATVEPSTAVPAGISAEMLIGKYVGSYTSTSRVVSLIRGIEITFTDFKGNDVFGTYSVVRKECSGVHKVEGKLLDGKMLEIVIRAVPIQGCQDAFVRFAISNGGKKLDRIMDESSVGAPVMSLSKSS